MFKTPERSDRRNLLQFVNAIIHSHDMLCDCSDGPFHSLKLLTTQLSPDLSKQQKEEIKKCLGDTTAATHGDDDGLDIGDLENLFGEDAEDGDG